MRVSRLLPLLGVITAAATAAQAASTLLYVSSEASDSLSDVSSTGVAGSTTINASDGIVVNPNDSLYVVADYVDSSDDDNYEIDTVSPAGAESTFISESMLGSHFTAGLAEDSSGNLYAAQPGDSFLSPASQRRILKITPGGTVSTFISGLNSPYGLAVDSGGNIYVSNELTGTINKVTSGGMLSTFYTLTEGTAANEHGLAFDSSGNLYLANYDTSTGQGEIFRINSTGTSSTKWALPGNIDPLGLAFGSNGTLYFSDFSSLDAPDVYSFSPTTGTATFFSTLANNGSFIAPALNPAAITGVWAVSGGDAWGSNKNWQNLVIPQLAQETATFGTAITTAATITLNSNWTVGNVNFNNASHSYTLAPGTAGSLTLDNAGNPATIDVQAGSHFISAPIILNSSVQITVTNSTDALQVSAGISGAGGITLNGMGTLNLSAANSYGGATTVNAGRLNLQAPGALPAGANLTIAAGASVAVTAQSSAMILQLNSLAVSGLLDLSNNDMIVHNGNLAALNTDISQGSANHWTGPAGITSSTAAGHTNTAMGIELNANAAGVALVSTFEGVSVSNTDVLIKYTYFGDANLDGIVNGSDYTLIDNGVNSSLTGWRNGDFNYDGIVNGDDYTLIDNAFNTQGAAITGLPVLAADVAQAAIPEPAMSAATLLTAFGLSARIRRRTWRKFTGATPNSSDSKECGQKYALCVYQRIPVSRAILSHHGQRDKMRRCGLESRSYQPWSWL